MWINKIYRRFPFISMHILLGQISSGSAETHIRRSRNLNNYLIDSCVANICAKNYYNLFVVFQATIDNIGDVFSRFCIF